MESGEELRRWDEMIPEALGLIFSKLSLYELLTIIPCVCRAWNRVVDGPYCWEVIDLDDWSAAVDNWSYEQREPELVHLKVHMLITRSNGTFRELRVCQIDDQLFLFIAQNARSLQILHLRWSEISDAAVEQAAPMFSCLIDLDLSFCKRIGARAVKAFGKSCPSLSVFRREMNSRDFETDEEARNELTGLSQHETQDEEARAIAAWMPNLRVLDMINATISDDSVLDILSCCRNLEYLNFSGCGNLNLEEELYCEKLPRLKRVTLSASTESDDYDYEYEYCSGYDIEREFDPGSPTWSS